MSLRSGKCLFSLSLHGWNNGVTKQQNQSSLDLGKVSMKVFYGSVSRTCAKYGSPDGTVFSTTACVKQVHNKATKWAQLCGYRSLSKLRSTRYTKFSLICIDYIFVKKKTRLEKILDTLWGIFYCDICDHSSGFNSFQYDISTNRKCNCD